MHSLRAEAARVSFPLILALALGCESGGPSEPNNPTLPKPLEAVLKHGLGSWKTIKPDQGGLRLSPQLIGEASDPTQVIDFEGFPDLTLITDQYQSRGVTFTGASILNEGGLLNFQNFPPRSGLGVVFDFPLSFGGTITASFATPVSSVGGYVTGNRVVTLRCFDATGTQVGSASLPAANFVSAGTGVAPNFLLNVAAPGIVRCVFSDGGNTYTIDDFTFTTRSCRTNVARLSQGDPRWASDVYDNSKLTIQALGCALTSLSMGLNTAGIPNDPGSLNQFMIQTDRDYLGSLVYWGPTTRDRSNGTLKFKSFRTGARQQLENVICNAGVPVVVGVNLSSGGDPQHYVLATGVEGDQILIADPGFPRTTLDAYQNRFETVGSVVAVADPATDLSELDLAVDDARLLVVDASGQRTGIDPSTGTRLEEIPRSVYMVEALANDVTGEPPSQKASFVQVLQPATGPLSVTVSADELGSHTLSVRAFSLDGSSQPAITAPVVVGPTSAATFEVQFRSSPGEQSGIERIATFESTLRDIRNSFQLGLIDVQGIATALTSQIDAAAEAARRGKNGAAANILRAFGSLVEAQKSVHIKEAAAQILSEDAKHLLAGL